MKEKGSQFERMAQDANENGGFSYDLRTGTPVRDAMMVGGGDEIKVPAPMQPQAIEQAAATHPGATHLGGWVHQSPGAAEPEGFIDFPTAHAPTPAGETAARTQSLKSDEIAYGVVRHGEYVGDRFNPFHADRQAGDIVPMDDPQHREVWASMPSKVGKASGDKPTGRKLSIKTARSFT